MIRIPIKFLEGDQLQLAMPRSFLESTRTSSDLIGPASFIDNPSHSYRGTTRRASIESDIGEAIIPLTHDAFEKCTILPLTPVMSSSLTKSLQDLQQSGSSNSGLDHINVVMFENPESVRVSLSSSLATVEAVVGFLMQKYQLKGRAYDYELRLLDDEDDYMADFDLPPLDFNVDMRSFAVDRVALCHHKRSASASADSWDSPLCRFLRVRMPQNECHVVPIVDDQNLKDVLEILARKRAQNLSPEEYTFYYMGHREPLDYEMAVCELTDYCIELRRQSQEYIVLPTTFGSSPNPSSFMFTDESASTYSEWSVQKKNRWGRKQYRLLGIDRYNLYNTSVTGTVKRSCRHISDVVAVKVIKNKPRCFRILFRNLEANEIIPVEYTAHSEMECAEIVARIDYLKSLMPPIR